MKKQTSLSDFSIFELKRDSLDHLKGGLDNKKKTETTAHWSRETAKDRDNDVETKPIASLQEEIVS